MASFRLYSKLDTFFDQSGQLLAGGSLKFYQAGTTTPQNVYGEKALATNNGSTIALDASGRPVHDIWGNVTAAYFVELYDASSVKQGEADNVEVPGGQAQVVPVPDANFFLTGDSTNFDTEDLSNRLVPDPSGNANKILSTDGSLLTWIAKPADGTAGTSDINTSITNVLKLNSAWQFVKGNGTATQNGTRACSANITFADDFSAAPAVFVQPKGGAPTAAGNVYPHAYVTAVTTTGFTVVFSTLTGGSSSDSSNGNSAITSDVAFDFLAVGAA